MVLFSNIQIANSAAQSNVRWMRVLQSGPEEDKFEEEEDPQEEEDDMEVDIEEDVIEVENPIEQEDETVPASVHEMASLSRRLCGRETAHALVEKKGKAKDEYYGKFILDLCNKVRSSVEQGTAAMEKLVEKLGNAKDKVECKKLKKELEEARGFMFKERPNEAINVPIEDEKSPSFEPRGSPHDASYCYSLNDQIAVERDRHANAGNDARGSGPVRGQDVAPAIREYTFTGFMKC
ncbi:hypothetical protein Tco_1481468, partial [Tanacetum coccineum]